MEFGILGPLVANAQGAEIALGGDKRRSLLALLLLHRNRMVSAEALIEGLWGELAPAGGQATLHSHVSNLRKALGADRLQTRSPGYVFTVADGELDADCFAADVKEAQNALAGGDAARALEAVERGLGRWRGHALADVASQPWATAEVARLEELRSVGVECGLEARLALGRPADVVGLAEAAIGDQPLREQLWSHLIVALYRSGRQADALRAYQRLRTILAEELGIDPSPELRDLERRILAQDAALAAVDVEPRAGPTPPKTDVLPSGVVTFLLTDVVGSTRLWDSQPQSMMLALPRHDEIMAASVAANNGSLLKARGEGDSTFSVFQRASDAVAAAVAAQHALAGEPWPPGAELHVRMAVHTGEAIERDGDYFGATVNRVARLRSLSQGDQVLLSQSAAEVVMDHLPVGCQLVPMGTLPLPDMSRPETVHRLEFSAVPGTGAFRVPLPATAAADGLALDVPMPPRLVRPGPVPFVGRAGELESIARSLKDVSEGGCRFVMVGGEPGIGKTRLCQTAAAEAAALGSIVLYGRSDEGLAIPYQPWAEALSHLVAHAPDRFVKAHVEAFGTELARLDPELAQRVSRPAGSGNERHLDGEAERVALFAAVVGLLAAAASDRPVFLVLDDLHWADKQTLLLLRHLASRPDGQRLVVVATYRDTELSAGDPLGDLLAGLRRESGTERLALRGLSDVDIVDLLETAMGQELDPVGVGLAHDVHREAGGNPFFSIEILRHLYETGAAQPDDVGRWRLNRAAGVDLPQSVREVVGMRVRRLGDQAVSVLAQAAVIGREVDLDVLVRVTGVDEDTVLDVLDAGVGAGILLALSDPVGRYTFTHALVQHTLYEDLGPARRQQVHRKVAEALEAIVGSDPGTRVGEIARQWLAATRPADVDRALHYALLAGEDALARLAPDEAIGWFTQAKALLVHVPAADSEVRARLLVGLGDAQRQVGDAAHRTTLLEGAQLARQAGRTDLLVTAALANNRGTSSMVGEFDAERVAILDAALAAVEPGDNAERALLLAIAAVEHSLDPERSRALAEESVDVARRLGRPDVILRVLNLANGYWIPDTLRDRLPRTEEAVALARSVIDPVARYFSYQWRVLTCLQAAQLDDSLDALDQLSLLAEELQQNYMRWMAPMLRSSLITLPRSRRCSAITTRPMPCLTKRSRCTGGSDPRTSST